MVDREMRDLLAEAIHGLAAGSISNHDFEDSLMERGIELNDPSHYSDSAIGPVFESAWCLYSDTHNYRLTGHHSLSPDARREVLRWVLFLRSDLEYEWPAFRLINPCWVSLSGFVLSFLTFGVLTRRQFLLEFAEWRKAGEYEAWPFIRRADFESALGRCCPLTVLRSCLKPTG